jgi:type II secretory pathway pseudopilin PulG
LGTSKAEDRKKPAVIGTAVAVMFTVIFYTCHRARARFTARGYSLVEAVCAIALIGIGVASTLGALTKFNSIAAISRNATGAYTVVMNQIDSFQSMSPFNPQKQNPDGTWQIPKDLINTPPTYDMNVTVPGPPHIIGYKDPITGAMSNQWPVYQYKDTSTGMTVVVHGTLTVAVTDVSATTAPNTFMAVVTIAYDYGNRTQAGGNPYTFSMTAIRTSDI